MLKMFNTKTSVHTTRLQRKWAEALNSSDQFSDRSPVTLTGALVDKDVWNNNIFRLYTRRKHRLGSVPRYFVEGENISSLIS